MLWGLPLGATAPVPQKSLDLIQRAEGLIEKHKLDKAIRLLEKADEIAGGNRAEALLPIARAHLQAARYPRALATVRTAIESSEDPEIQAVGYRTLGRILFESTLKESHPDPITLRIDMMIFLADLPPASSIEETIEAFYEHRLSKYAGKLEEAQVALNTAIELQEQVDPLTHYYLAEVLTSLRRTDEAAARLDTLFALVGTEALPRGPGQLQCSLQQRLKPQEPLPRFVGEEVTPPKALHRVKAKYTRKALANQVKGTVLLAAVIDEEGNVRCARALKGLPMGLTESAITALQATRFEPTRRSGEAVSTFYTLQINFYPGRPY